jgi:PAS domain S-box-containing protein
MPKKKPIRVQRSSSSEPDKQSRSASTDHEIKIVKKGKAPQIPDITPFDQLMAALYDAIIVTSKSGGVLLTNARAEHYFRYSDDEMMGLNITNLIERAGPSLIKTLQNNITPETSSVLSGNCIRKNRSRFAADIAVTAITLGAQEGFCFAVRDVTSRKQTESRLTTENRALMNASSAIAITDGHGRIQYANPALYSLTGYENDGASLMVISDIWQDQDDAQDVFSVILEDNTWQGEFLAAAADGSELHIQASISPNKDDSAEIIGMVFSLVDVTEQKKTLEALSQANRELMQAEKIKAGMETLAALSHELNNPLQILLALVEMEQKQDYKVHLDRILDVLHELQKQDVMAQIVSEGGAGRLDIPDKSNITPCNLSRVLVVDDEESLRSIFGQLIGMFLPHLKVDFAEDGEEAVTSFSKHHQAIIIMDLAMPRLNGEDAYHMIRNNCKSKNWQEPAVIFCTGFAPSQSIHDLVENNPLLLMLNKPIGKKDLINAITDRLALDYFSAED